MFEACIRSREVVSAAIILFGNIKRPAEIKGKISVGTPYISCFICLDKVILTCHFSVGFFGKSCAEYDFDIGRFFMDDPSESYKENLLL